MLTIAIILIVLFAVAGYFLTKSKSVNPVVSSTTTIIVPPTVEMPVVVDEYEVSTCTLLTSSIQARYLGSLVSSQWYVDSGDSNKVYYVQGTGGSGLDRVLNTMVGPIGSSCMDVKIYLDL